jgi:hypothetical protein
MRMPDGEDVCFVKVAYNESRKVLICECDGGANGNEDVWRYDLATGQSRWIAKGRWNCTRAFAWSPDGSKVAFIASTRGTPAAFVMQYDLDTDKLEQLAGNVFGNVPANGVQEGDSVWRHRRPVYSEDGNWLYCVSMDQRVMRVDLRTRQCEQLPLGNAVAILTVRGEDLVYARELIRGEDDGYQIIKVNLNAADDSHVQKVYTGRGILNWNFVSPSRRFVLFFARAGYDGDTRMVDVEKGTTCAAYGLWGDLFPVFSTVK